MNKNSDITATGRPDLSPRFAHKIEDFDKAWVKDAKPSSCPVYRSWTGDSTPHLKVTRKVESPLMQGMKMQAYRGS